MKSSKLKGNSANMEAEAASIESKLTELRMAMAKEKSKRESIMSGATSSIWNSGSSGFMQSKYRQKVSGSGLKPPGSNAPSASAGMTMAATAAALQGNIPTGPIPSLRKPSGSVSGPSESNTLPGPKPGSRSGPMDLVLNPGKGITASKIGSTARPSSGKTVNILTVHDDKRSQYGSLSKELAEDVGGMACGGDEDNLLDGNFDEAESHRSFMEAVMAWRRGLRTDEQEGGEVGRGGGGGADGTSSDGRSGKSAGNMGGEAIGSMKAARTHNTEAIEIQTDPNSARRQDYMSLMDPAKTKNYLDLKRGLGQAEQHQKMSLAADGGRPGISLFEKLRIKQASQEAAKFAVGEGTGRGEGKGGDGKRIGLDVKDMHKGGRENELVDISKEEEGQKEVDEKKELLEGELGIEEQQDQEMDIFKSLLGDEDVFVTSSVMQGGGGESSTKGGKGKGGGTNFLPPDFEEKLAILDRLDELELKAREQEAQEASTRRAKMMDMGGVVSVTGMGGVTLTRHTRLPDDVILPEECF